MPLPSSAGELRDRVAFEQRVDEDDNAGNTQGAFEHRFDVAAAIVGKFGGEAVVAARLEGREPATITVRYSPVTATVTPEWRIRDTRTGVVYNIRSIDDRMRRRQWLDMLCEAGVAT